MLSRFDEYPIHQTPEPLAHPVSGDRNFYDRYFFNGFSRDADLYFGAALGLYPNRRVMDAAFSVVREGLQHVVRASRLAPADRGETQVGPISVEVVEPFRTLRWRVGPNDFGLSADLVFHARASMVEEARMTRHFHGRAIMDATRFTQHGRWQGELSVAGARVDVRPEGVLGVRDRSWGVRPVGEQEPAAPGQPAQFFWLWAPVHFDDVCVLAGIGEDGEGRVYHRHCVVVPVLARGDGEAADVPVAAPNGPETVPSFTHRVDWKAGTRRAASARLTLHHHRAAPEVITLHPTLTFQMRGLGYLEPEWGHGVWKGPSAIGGETWTLDELDPMDPRNLHVQQLCQARMGEREGIGVLEQLVIGPHAPSGFQSVLDPAAEGATSAGS